MLLERQRRQYQKDNLKNFWEEEEEMKTERRWQNEVDEDLMQIDATESKRKAVKKNSEPVLGSAKPVVIIYSNYTHAYVLYV